MKKTSGGQIDIKVILILVFIFIFSLFMARFVTKLQGTLVLGATIGMSLFILCFFSVKYALYTLIFSMLLSPEFGSRTTEGGGVTIRLDDFLLVIIAFGWFVRSAVYKELGLLKKTPLNLPIFFYTVACVVSTAFGMMFGKVQVFKGFFFILKYVEYFIVYFMAVNYIHERKQLRNLLIAMIFVFVIVCFTSMAQIPGGERITAPFEGKGGEPNTLAGYLLVMLSIVMGLLLNTDKADSFRYKVTLIAMVFLALIPIMFSQSRGTWLAVIPWYITFIAISKKRVMLFVILVLLVVAAPFVVPENIKERVLYTFKKQEGWVSKYQEKVGGVVLDTSTSERVSSIKRAFTAFTKHPIFGYGITGWRFLDAQYLKTLVETGLLGFTTFGFMIYIIIRETRRVYKSTKDKFYRGISMGVFAATIAMLTHSWGANTFIIVRIMEPFWFLMAIVVSIPYVEGEKKDSQTKEDNKGKPETGRVVVPNLPFILKR